VVSGDSQTDYQETEKTAKNDIKASFIHPQGNIGGKKLKKAFAAAFANKMYGRREGGGVPLRGGEQLLGKMGGHSGLPGGKGDSLRTRRPSTLRNRIYRGGSKGGAREKPKRRGGGLSSKALIQARREAGRVSSWEKMVPLILPLEKGCLLGPHQKKWGSQETES